MKRSVGVVSLLSVTPLRESKSNLPSIPIEKVPEECEECDRSELIEEDHENFRHIDSSALGDSDMSVNSLLKTPDDKRPPLASVSCNLSPCSTPSGASCHPIGSGAYTPCYNTPLQRRFDRSRINYSALKMSLAADEEKIVEQCRKTRPLSYRAILHLQLSFLIDIPFHLVQPTEDLAPVEDTRPKRPPSIVRTPSRVIRAFTGRSKGADEEVSDSSNASPDKCSLRHNGQLERIKSLIIHLNQQERLHTKCLFRISGNVRQIQDLANDLLSDEEKRIKLDNFKVHEVACALKSSLMKMPKCIIPEDLHPMFAQVVQMTEPRTDDQGVIIPFVPGDLELLQIKQLKALRLLLLILDDSSRSFLQDLLDILKKTSDREELTCMSDNSLSIIFGPVLFRCEIPDTPEAAGNASRAIHTYNKAVEMLLAWYPIVFKVPVCVLEPMKRALESADNDLEHATCVSYVQRGKREPAAITEYALSELYAHIASMPDSAKKRRYIKQVSNRNGGIVSPDSPTVSHVERAHAESARQMQCL